MIETNADGISDLIRDQIINTIRDDSKKGSISSERRLVSATPGVGDLSGFYGKLSENKDFSDIKEIRGGAGIYFYSTKFMADRYAGLAVMLEEGDLLKLLVSTIREDCRIYPRTSALELFEEAPYRISPDDLQDLLEIIRSDEQCNDIAFCKTSVGTVYLYSTDYMQSAQAEYISEWDAVGQYESQ